MSPLEGGELSDFLEYLQAEGSKHLPSGEPVHLLPFFEMIGLMFLTAAAIADRAKNTCPSPAYARYLIDERRMKPIDAARFASLAKSFGIRRVEEDARLPSVVEAIRFFSKPGRRRKPSLLRANVLLMAREETSIVETIFRKAGISDAEFTRLLGMLVDGQPEVSSRVSEIAAAVAPFAEVPRGPKVSVASATHEFFLTELAIDRAYTLGVDERADYCDPLTRAARQEFDDPYFSPQSARRRSRKLKTKSSKVL